MASRAVIEDMKREADRTGMHREYGDPICLLERAADKREAEERRRTDASAIDDDAPQRFSLPAAPRQRPSQSSSVSSEFISPRKKRCRVRLASARPLPTPVSNSYAALSEAVTSAAEMNVVDVAAPDEFPLIAPGKQRKKHRKRRVPSKTLERTVPITLPPPRRVDVAPPKPSPAKQPTTRQRHEPFQCFRCQDFGHYAYCCPNAERCVKCTGPHDAQHCLRPRTQLATCANCSGPHPASYRGCPSWRAVTARARRRRPHAPPPPSRPDADPPSIASLVEQLAGLVTSPVMLQVVKLLSVLAAADQTQHAALLLAAVASTV